MINQKLNKILNSDVETPDGKATLNSIYVTELGYIMAKIFYSKKRVFKNFKIGDINSLLNKDIKLLSDWNSHVELVK